MLNFILKFKIDWLVFSALSFAGMGWLQYRLRKTGKAVGVPWFIWFLLILMVIFSGIFSETAAESARTSVRSMLQGFAPTYAFELKKMGHARLGFETPPDDPDYLSMIQTQIHWLNVNPIVSDIYTFRKRPDGKIALLVDSETDYDRNGKYEGEREGRTPIGEIFEEANEHLEEAFRGKEMFRDIPYTDRWGTWVSAFVPITDDEGRVEGVLGVDYPAREWNWTIFWHRGATLGFMTALVILLVASTWVTMFLRVEILERIRIEKALRESESRLQQAERVARLGHWSYDAVLDRMDWSPEALDILFLDQSASCSRLQDFLDRLQAEDREACAAGIKNAFSEGRCHEAEYGIRRAGREIGWIHLTVRPKSKDKLFGTLMDVTEQKKIVSRLLHAQKMESIGRLAAGIAHDFNNILTVIKGYAEIRLHQLEENHPLRRDFEEIASSIRQAVSLTQRLLAYSGRQMIRPVVLDANEVVLEMRKTLAEICGEKAEINCDLSGRCLVRMDRYQLEQVLMDAVSYSQGTLTEGGRIVVATKTLILGHRSTLHNPTHLNPGEYVLVEVSDNGPGVDEDAKAHIFEPFSSTKPRSIGTGMGLAAVQSIVQKSGGEVSFWSLPGEGMSIKIYLPRCEEEVPAPGKSAVPASVPNTKTKTILVVDDEPKVLQVAGEILRRGGYKVLEASDGADALRVASSYPHSIDVLFTDVVMPRLDGRRLAEELEIRRPGIRVLYASGYTDGGIVRGGSIDSNIHFLEKPYSPRDLVNKIEGIL